MVVFQKLEGKTTTLKFWNQKLEGKTTTLNLWNQKLEGKTTTLNFWDQKLEGKTTTPKNCVLTNFLHERSIIFLLVFSLIRFWMLLRNDCCLSLTQHSNLSHVSHWVSHYRKIGPLDFNFYISLSKLDRQTCFSVSSPQSLELKIEAINPPCYEQVHSDP